MEFDFIDKFNQKLTKKDIDWGVNALMSSNGKLISLGSDSKLIGRIFELVSFGVLQEIADENGYILKPSNQQTVYPDFTLMKDENDKHKIAIDIKTTYRAYKAKGGLTNFVFTLGSYASFLRNGTKNIMYPYSDYQNHFIIGFIYTRNDTSQEGQIFELTELDDIEVPYKDVEVFVQEKYKIAGEKPGSGNTENIGSYKTNNIDYLINGEGPFTMLGIETFEDYWKGYPKYRAAIKEYTSLDEYFDWSTKKGKDVTKLKRIYTLWKELHN